MSRDVPGNITEREYTAGGAVPGNPEPFGSLDLDDDSEGAALSIGSSNRVRHDGADDRGDPGRSRSLDALEIPEEGDPDLPLKRSGSDDQQPAEGSQDPEAVHPPRGALKRIGAHWKAILIACCGLVLTLAAAVGIKAWVIAPKTTVPIVTSLRKPIPVPRFQETLDFFIVAAAQAEAGILSLGIEFEFLSPAAHQGFVEGSVLFRDVVYRFLESRRPAKNSQKEWGHVVQNELQEHIRTTLPNSRADIIRLGRFEKL